MKLQFLATGQAPDSYHINGETITVNNREKSEDIDLSLLEEGGVFKGVELDVIELSASRVIRNAERRDGELYVTLCQPAGSGYWRKSDWIDANKYNPDETYIQKVD